MTLRVSGCGLASSTWVGQRKELMQNNAFAFFCQKGCVVHSQKVLYLSPQMNGA
jgi:hypothetical protein